MSVLDQTLSLIRHTVILRMFSIPNVDRDLVPDCHSLVGDESSKKSEICTECILPIQS